GPFALTVTGIGGTSALHLVVYDHTLHAWTLLVSPVDVSGSQATTPLPGPGSYALVRADDAQGASPALGGSLEGGGKAPPPAAATGVTRGTPPTLPPTGGTALGHLTVKNAPGVPSGTVVQAVVTETFTLVSGEVASEEQRIEDIVLYRSADGLEAAVPI